MDSSPSAPAPISSRPLQIDTPAPAMPQSVSTLRSGHLTLDTLSPVNQNGSFEFDRVIKAGEVLKRTRKTKSWKPIYMILRPNLLSIYRDSSEAKLRHQLTLSDLTAIARQKDPKGKAKHVFGLFSPSRNFHLEARNDKEAQEWVELIRREARIDEDEEVMTLASPGGAKSTYRGFGRHSAENPGQRTVDQSAGYSSSEAEPFPNSVPVRKRQQSSVAQHSARRASHTMDYSGPEHASYSDFSDSAGPIARLSALSLSHPEQRERAETLANHPGNAVYGNPVQNLLADTQEPKSAHVQDDERVYCHGWIYLLKTSRGMRQWKKLWMVLRPKSLALYKNEEEYSAVLILPFGGIIDAVDIDPISHSKRCCLQIITEEKSYRLCVPDEDSLARWLGALKSLLVKRKEIQMHRDNAPKEL